MQPIGVWLCSGGERTSSNPNLIEGSFVRNHGEDDDVPFLPIDSVIGGLAQPLDFISAETKYEWHFEGGAP